MFKELLDSVRVQGHITLNESPFVKDLLPIIYLGEANPDAPGSTPYYSSGGRSMLFNRGGITYRVKGCDPTAKLTERVAKSDNNKFEDVISAYEYAQLHSREKTPGTGFMFRDNRPFGVLNLRQAECEKVTHTNLANLYETVDIENPCEFVSYENTGIEIHGERTYQAAFRLPRIEADFRIKEFEKLLTERLDQCSPDEIAKKTKNINRLFGRFVYWAGVNTTLLASSGVLPVKSSFVSQNWAISRYKDGYGLFRVDHSSTKVVKPDEAYKNLVEEEKGVPHIANNFSVFPGRVQIAANPKAFLKKKDVKFSEILFMREGPGIDETRLLNAHVSVFNLGVQGGLEAITKKNNTIGPIPEQMFYEALA